MKVLHISTSDVAGGAAKAAHRIHKSLEKAGLISLMLVQFKNTDESTVLNYADGTFEKLKSRALPYFDKFPLKKYKEYDKGVFWTNAFINSNIISKINAINPDIVNIHWIGGGFVSIKEISQIYRPIVWTFHDLWAFTGGCHYPSIGCSRYANGCGKCPVLSSIKEKDLSSHVFRKKVQYWKDLNLSIVTPSHWLANLTKESLLFKNHSIKVIPNAIDTTIFKPIDKKMAKTILNISGHKKILLFGSVKPTSDDRKGFELLHEAMQHFHLRNKDYEWEIIFFGSSETSISLNFSFPTRFVGVLNDDISLALLYSASDVMIVPSKQENLSNTIMESLSCGTPVVAFDIGGNSDMVGHKKNGYLAEPFDTKDLAHGIEWVVENNMGTNNLSVNARSTVLNNYREDIVATFYTDLYKSLI